MLECLRRMGSEKEWYDGRVRARLESIDMVSFFPWADCRILIT